MSQSNPAPARSFQPQRPRAAIAPYDPEASSLDVLAPCGKHQQRLGLGMHRLVQQDFAQALAQLGSPGFARDQHVQSLPAQGIGKTLQMRGLPGTIHAF